MFLSLTPAHENARIIWALLAQPERSYAANYGLHPLTTAILSPGVHAEEAKNIKTSRRKARLAMAQAISNVMAKKTGP
ncbi:MAG: hypothetical protein ACYCVY_08985 [Acidiferrobacteraceae bacterium]